MAWAEPAGPRPPGISRAGEQAAARHELAKAIYGRARPGLLQRLYDDVGHLLERLLQHLGSLGGSLALAGVLVAVALVVLGLRTRLGTLRRAAPGSAATELSGPLSSAQYRAAAAAAAAAGAWDRAVIAAARALARGLEERELVASVPGRTAHELAAQAALALPAQAASLRAAADAFDLVAYGRRGATRAGYETVTEADRACSAARPALRLGAVAGR